MQDDNTISIRISINRGSIRRLVVVATTLALVIPTAAWASHRFGFTDVPNSNVFHDDIDWMKIEGVTRGCNPPDNTKYCPKDNVTREQMAAFMHRLDTQDVFMTPDEVDDKMRFAVVSGGGILIVGDGVNNAVDTGPGTYELDFGTNVWNCSWTGTVGNRDGATVQNGVVTLNHDATDASVIHAVVTDGATGNPLDEDFNVTLTC